MSASRFPRRSPPGCSDALPQIQAIYACFSPLNTRIEVEATARDHPLPPSPAARADAAVGLFFSLGVDSFYSLLKNERDHPVDDETITHLIPVHGFDVADGGADTHFPPPLLDNFRRVAADRGKTLLPVATNLRRVSGLLASWTTLHGGAMASVALALGTMFRRVLIAASTTYDKLYPWGSHPFLDPLWSTENLTFVHDGCELDTIDKTRFVARSPLVLDTLRPCPGYGPAYNCGQCLKCLRTQIDLMQAGYLDRCRTLPQEIDAERLRVALRQSSGPVHIANFRRRLETLESAGGPARLRDVLAEYLALEPRGRTILPAVPAGEASARRRLVKRLLRRAGS